MPTRISLPDHLLPVQALFNAAWDATFVRFLESLSRGIDCVFNDCGCEFPSGLEPGEEPFEGVRFWLFDEKVILTESEFHQILKQVGETQKKRVPEQAAQIDAILAKLGRQQ